MSTVVSLSLGHAKLQREGGGGVGLRRNFGGEI